MLFSYATSRYRWLIGLLLTIVVQQAKTQMFIGTTAEKATRNLSRYSTREGLNTITQATDSSTTFLIRDTSKQALDIVLYFNAKGRCIREVRRPNCDSCLQKYQADLLDNKLYRWRQQGPDVYVSMFAGGITLITNQKPGFAYELRKTPLLRKVYKALPKM